MNKRIIGIFLCILIITLQFVAVGSIAFAQNSIVISARPIGKVAESQRSILCVTSGYIRYPIQNY